MELSADGVVVDLVAQYGIRRGQDTRSLFVLLFLFVGILNLLYYD